MSWTVVLTGHARQDLTRGARPVATRILVVAYFEKSLLPCPQPLPLSDELSAPLVVCYYR